MGFKSGFKGLNHCSDAPTAYQPRCFRIWTAGEFQFAVNRWLIFGYIGCKLAHVFKREMEHKLLRTMSNKYTLFCCGAATQRGSWPRHSWGFYITHNDAPQSVGLLWTSDQLVAETSTWQHTTLTTDKHPCLRWDSNPQSQQESGRRPTP